MYAGIDQWISTLNACAKDLDVTNASYIFIKVAELLQNVF